MKFFVGTYTSLGGPGAALCSLNGGELRIDQTAPEIGDPSYVILSGDQKTLYTVGESAGLIAAYDLSDGRMRLVSQQSTLGSAPCHLTLSADERFLYVANYESGSVAVLPVDGARISPCIQVIRHDGHGANPDRQEHAHAHFVAFDQLDDCRLCVADLGIDAVMMYRQDRQSGLLTFEARLNTPAGLGPRHLAFGGSDTLYIAYELGSAVGVYRREHDGWQPAQTLSTLPGDWQGENTVAAIRLAHGRLYVSNRGHDSIAVFEVRPDGTLSPEGIHSTFGRTPRDFAVLPDGRLLVAHQSSGDVRLLSPCMQPTGEPLPVPGAVCVLPIVE